ncbi:MAG: ComEC/Rec2 family competence protein [Parvularculaceae bacterium]
MRFLRASAARDAARLGLWAPAAIGVGAALYLGLTTEPPAILAPLALLAATVAAFRLERFRPAAVGAAFTALGFCAADFRAERVDAPILDRDIDYAKIDGRLLAVEESETLRRLIIAPDWIDGVDNERLPARLRLSWRGGPFEALPGERVTLTASLSPTPQPVAPGGYDFARHLYFLRIGAVGIAFSPPSAIVAAVVTGKREAVSDEAEAVFRDSGLTHLLSISGIHLSLATGIVFFALRAALALIEPVALRFPIKKWAAAAAILSGAAYLSMSGLAWPAQRAFLMTSIFYVAILFDRRALSLRNVAIAAVVILLLAPEAVANPGFQMSFAAVTALIAAFEWASARTDPNRSFSIPARLKRYAAGIAATDIISSLATAPFALFHFNRAANFGLIANSISIPLMGFWVMPVAILALLAIPFGLDRPIWCVAAAGVEIMLALGEWTAALPGAVTVFPKWPAAVLPAFAFGGLWLCLMTAPWRLAGLAAVPVAVLMIASHRGPQVFVTPSGENAAAVILHAGERALVVFDLRADRFAAGAYLEQAGLDERKEAPFPMVRAGLCDDEGCVAAIGVAQVAFTDRPETLDDDCARAALVVTFYRVSRKERQGCAGAIIDRGDVWREGAHAATILPSGNIVIESVRDRRGDRAWTGGRDQ